MIFPLPCFSICLAASCASVNMANTFTKYVFSSLARGMSAQACKFQDMLFSGGLYFSTAPEFLVTLNCHQSVYYCLIDQKWLQELPHLYKGVKISYTDERVL